jgi:methylmalonyl-CoA mutase
MPRYEDDGEILRWQMAVKRALAAFRSPLGSSPFKRENEDPTRMFAGEGDSFRTNTRFHLLADGMPAKRLSTAFDSVTLYGNDPDRRPDIYGKVGNSGVSIATLDDMKVLYSGFDLCDPATSVSMTINGPAPTILAMFVNTAIDQQLDKFATDNGREPTDDEADKIARGRSRDARHRAGRHPEGGPGAEHLHLLDRVLAQVMGDIQEYFVQHDIRNFYSVSISGYHIAEAGANPISQLAFTLSNGFTFRRAYLARGMRIDDFAPNLSFFFSYGMDPEYSVIGRVARRIWAVAMKNRYGANERSQKLKFHSQTSGRSLHAQEISFNDIRTTLQALISTYDNTNSLHTNAYDEAITTPTEESVRRAMAIQLIINANGASARTRTRTRELHHRGADRSRRGGGAEGVRGDLGARRRAGRDGDRLPARQDPGRVDVLRAQEARRQLSDRRRQHVPKPACRGGAATRSALRAHRPPRRRNRSSRGARGLPRAARARSAGGARALEAQS